MAGFLEETPGVRSMTRLTAAVLLVVLVCVAVAAIIVALKGGEHAAGIVGASGTLVLGLAGGIWGALKERQ